MLIIFKLVFCRVYFKLGSEKKGWGVYLLCVFFEKCFLYDRTLFFIMRACNNAMLIELYCRLVNVFECVVLLLHEVLLWEFYLHRQIGAFLKLERY